MTPVGAGRWLKGVADRGIRNLADRHTIRTVDVLGVQARFKCVTPHELGRLSTFGGEPIVLGALQRLRPRDCFYDIGANIGLYTVLAARLVGAGGTIVAFEPEGANFARLQANARLNGLSQVVACPFALSDRTGPARLRLHSSMTGEGGHALVGGAEGDTTVFCLPLDQVLETFGIRQPDHIKIDVEGHEEQVLAGMARVLASSSLRTVILEAHYYDQQSDGRVHYGDAELAQKRRRLLAILGRHRFLVAGEQVTSEGGARFAHLLFTRD